MESENAYDIAIGRRQKEPWRCRFGAHLRLPGRSFGDDLEAGGESGPSGAAWRCDADTKTGRRLAAGPVGPMIPSFGFLRGSDNGHYVK